MKVYTHYFKIINSKNFTIVLLLTIGFLQSCNNEETEPINFYHYYPTELGLVSIYEIEETVYSAGRKDPARKRRDKLCNYKFYRNSNLFYLNIQKR